MALKEDFGSDSYGKQMAAPIIDAVEGIANLVGLGRWFRGKVRNIHNSASEHGELLTDAELQSMINAIVARAQAMGAQKLAELNNKLAQLPTATSPTLRSFVNSTVANIKGQIKQQNIENAEIDAKAAKAANYASEYAVASSGDIATGKAHELQNKAINAADETLELAQNIEQKVR